MSDGRLPMLVVSPDSHLTEVDPSRPCGERQRSFSFLALVSACATRYGPELVTRWAARHGLDPQAIGGCTWVPVEYCFSLAEAAVNEHHDGDPRAAAALGDDCAAQEINAFFRFALGFTSPTTLLGLASRFWRQYYDRSELVVVEAVGDTALLELRGWGLMNAAAAYVHGGAMLRWLETCPATDVRFTAMEFVAPGLLRLTAAWRR